VLEVEPTGHLATWPPEMTKTSASYSVRVTHAAVPMFEHFIVNTSKIQAVKFRRHNYKLYSVRVLCHHNSVGYSVKLSATLSCRRLVLFRSRKSHAKTRVSRANAPPPLEQFNCIFDGALATATGNSPAVYYHIYHPAQVRIPFLPQPI